MITVIDESCVNNIIGIHFDDSFLLAGVQQGSFPVSLLSLDSCGGNDFFYSPP